ncbi:MAG: hypothetical protein LBT55_06080, partial [Clostridiaceae bacterium]|nr:hypothetical protein [Clostridiaceae bacterium]
MKKRSELLKKTMKTSFAVLAAIMLLIASMMILAACNGAKSGGGSEELKLAQEEELNSSQEAESVFAVPANRTYWIYNKSGATAPYNLAWGATFSGKTQISGDFGTIGELMSSLEGNRSSAECLINFGDGTSTLDIGNAGITLSNGTYNIAGTLAANLTSAAVVVNSGATVNSTANI